MIHIRPIKCDVEETGNIIKSLYKVFYWELYLDNKYV